MAVSTAGHTGRRRLGKPGPAPLIKLPPYAPWLPRVLGTFVDQASEGPPLLPWPHRHMGPN